MCAGAASFEPGGFPKSSLTADGDTMAYRAGAEIMGREFVDVHWTYLDNPAWGVFQRHTLLHNPWPLKLYPLTTFRVPMPRSTFRNALGDSVGGTGLEIGSNLIFEAHAGRAPVFMQLPTPGLSELWMETLVGGASAGWRSTRSRCPKSGKQILISPTRIDTH